MPFAGMIADAAGGGAAGSGGQREDECGPVPALEAKGTSEGRARGAAMVEYDVQSPNVWLSMRTTLTVPAEPGRNGTIFVWSGVQPGSGGRNFEPVGNGVLQSTLTWGPSCAPGAPTEPYESWWISPLYVNVNSLDPAYSGCHGGPVITAQPSDELDLSIRWSEPQWLQRMANLRTLKSSEFGISLQGQDQGRVFFLIELPGENKLTEDIIYSHSVLTMAMPDPSACEPVFRGPNDFASKPRVSADGTRCCIDRIVLRAQGVTATSTDP
jgi:hypothetical protein